MRTKEVISRLRGRKVVASEVGEEIKDICDDIIKALDPDKDSSLTTGRDDLELAIDEISDGSIRKKIRPIFFKADGQLDIALSLFKKIRDLSKNL